MTTLRFHQTTTTTPEQFVAALTDFGPGRSKIFENSADERLEVHQRGPHEADVTEGSNGIWERLHYDWSAPNEKSITVRVAAGSLATRCTRVARSMLSGTEPPRCEPRR